MCGICGMLSLDGAEVDAGALGAMTAALRHRGPDESGFHFERPIALGHRRLSIIDVAGGHQPMTTADRSLWITFNGEIFNYLELREELIRKGYAFATGSDTEVLLHLYREEGEACVKRLNGQWAFAIWDSRQKKLFLSRDRFGIRPLFYTQAAGKFLFASEIKALLACKDVPRELDLAALDQIFTFWVTLPPRTAFRDIHQLPPGHSLVIEDGRIRITPHWRLEYFPADHGNAPSEQRLVEQLLQLLLDATRIRLRSDVPVGAYLSGGLDSTFITALARKYVGGRLHTFSVSFEDAAFDEADYQREASAFLQTQHSSVHCSSRDIAAAFPDVVRHAEQPLLRTAPAPLFLLSRMVRTNGFKVVLTGEGADEVFGGYDIFKEAKIRRFWARQPGSLQRPLLLKRLYPYLDGIRNQPPAYLQQFFSVAPEDQASPFFSHLPRWRLTARLKNFWSAGVRAAVRPELAFSALEQFLPVDFSRWRHFTQAEFLETAYLLPGYILSSQGDRMAMAHAVEGRYPFLDHRVVEFAARLDPNLKMKVLDQKYLLKRAARGWIPESITRRYKQPYRAPDGPGLIGPGAEYVDEVLSAGRIRGDGIFDAPSVERLIRKFRSGRAIGAADNMALVGILSTQILLDQFVNQRQVPAPRVTTAAAETVER